MVGAAIGLPADARRFRTPLVVSAGIAIVGALVIATVADTVAGGAVGLGYLAVLSWVVAHDVSSLRAPNRIVLPAMACAAIASIPFGSSGVAACLGGGTVAFLVLLVIALVGGGRMGMGDVKFGTLCGMATGAQGLMMLFAGAFVGGGLVAAVLLVSRVRQRRDVIAFTPFLAAGVLMAWLISGSYFF